MAHGQIGIGGEGETDFWACGPRAAEDGFEEGGTGGTTRGHGEDVAFENGGIVAQDVDDFGPRSIEQGLMSPALVHARVHFLYAQGLAYTALGDMIFGGDTG